MMEWLYYCIDEKASNVMVRSSVPQLFLTQVHGQPYLGTVNVWPHTDNTAMKLQLGRLRFKMSPCLVFFLPSLVYITISHGYSTSI